MNKLRDINWFLVFMVFCLSISGFVILYSAAGGSFAPWASKQIIRFGFAVIGMIIIATINIRVWYNSAYWFYFACLLSLILVEIFGSIGSGAQRWLNFGIIKVQPSELMKIAVILALARYFHRLPLEQTRKMTSLFIPIILVFLPVILIFKQPDFGTAIVLAAGGISMFFLAGARLWLFIAGSIAAMGSVPIIWTNLRPYQKGRILTFLDPERDPLGAGYHVIQSKIALGSGGLWGKGLEQGTQSLLNFLPEKHTDFVFAMFAEELGFVGGMVIILLYFLIIMTAFATSVSCRHQFGRLLAMGIGVTLFLYIFVNLGMVMSLLPVVGIPLPLLSYGGSALITTMLAIGLLLSVHIHRDTWNSGLSD